MQGIIQENDRYRDQMDRLEKELSRLRKLHAAFGRKDVGKRPALLLENEAGNDNGDENKTFPWTTAVTSFLFNVNLL
jgi:hypothetical protein